MVLQWRDVGQRCSESAEAAEEVFNTSYNTICMHVCCTAGTQTGTQLATADETHCMVHMQAILNATRCQVHTLDCTYPGRSLDRARHSYHKVCIGSSSSSSPGFSSWQQATRLWGGKPVAVLKVDIEGHESPLLAELEPGDHLPQQLVIEMHITARHPHTGRGFPLVTGPAPRDQAQAAVLFMHLAALGYAIVAAEPNAGSPCCAEFTFLRVETARPLRLDRGGLALPTGHGG